MAVNLASRLKRLKEANHTATPWPGAAPDKGHRPLAGWEERSPLVWFKETRISRTASHGARVLTGVILPPETDPASLLFFDTETTGLSTGAGTVVFLASFGSFRPDGSLSVRQYFLADYPGEPAFLEALRPELSGGKTLVSYNGRSFDTPLLRSRFLLSRIPFPVLPHADLLYPARRFWKQVLPGCSLSEMERSVLFKKRTLDIPGAEAPDIWFRFVREGAEPRLEALLAHNLEDTGSLAELLFLMEGLPERLVSKNDPADQKSLPFPLDRTGLALHLLKQGENRGRLLLETVAAADDRHALRILGQLLRREERWEEAAACWERLNTPGPSPYAAVELAKYCEHRLKDYPRAAGYVRELLTAGLPLPEGLREELRKRLQRVESKGMVQT